MPSYTFTRSNQLKTRRRNGGLRIVIFVAGILTVLTIFVQLYVMSIFAPMGGKVSELEARRDELVVENKKLSDEIAQARKLEAIKQKADSKEYVNIDSKEVGYLTIGN